MPPSIPKDFNFVFNYGVDAKNQLDTLNGKYTKDMIKESSITTDLKLSAKEMNTIYSEMEKINLLNYPKKFNLSDNSVKPFKSYSIKITIDWKESTIHWRESTSEDKDYIQLNELSNKIQEIINNKEEYKKLPPTQGGYI